MAWSELQNLFKQINILIFMTNIHIGYAYMRYWSIVLRPFSPSPLDILNLLSFSYYMYLTWICFPLCSRSQFRHSRLKDHSNMQVSNPIYMPQTTEDDDEDESHQPLDQPFNFDPEKVSSIFCDPFFSLTF